MTAPEWLTQRGGACKQGPDGKTWYVILDGRPSYALQVVPAAGKFTCVIRQTVNGKRLDGASTQATAVDALNAGLNELRTKLGWG